MTLFEQGNRWYRQRLDKPDYQRKIEDKQALKKAFDTATEFSENIKGKSILVDYETMIKNATEADRGKHAKIITKAIYSGGKVRWLMPSEFDRRNIDHVHAFVLDCNKAGLAIKDPFDAIYVDKGKVADEIWQGR